MLDDRVRKFSVRLEIRDDEALDGYLERVRFANAYTDSAFIRMLAGTGSGALPMALMMLRPADDLIARVAALCDLPIDQVARATLRRFDNGLPLTLAVVNPAKAVSTLRAAAAGNWFPAGGSKICVACVLQGSWRVSWRLPTSVACTPHGLYLTDDCPSCLHAFRYHLRGPLRPGGAFPNLCGNPTGRGQSCDRRLDGLAHSPAPEAAVRLSGRLAAAHSGEEQQVLGERLSAAAYCAELHNLSALLSHLACQPAASGLAPWCSELREEAQTRTGQRGPRWALAPPRKASLRAAVIGTADDVLRSQSATTGADKLSAWVAVAPRHGQGALGWMADRTTMSPVTSRLVIAAYAPHRRLSHQLTTTGSCSLTLDQVPQVLPASLYGNLESLLAVRPTTGRLFASLCLARTTTDKPMTWADAADLLGLERDLGRRTARAASARIEVPPEDLNSAISALEAELENHATDFRHLERRVQVLLGNSAWFDEWCRCRPGTRKATRAFAISWLWTEVAHGHLTTSPAWLNEPLTRRAVVSYRQFAASLSDTASDRLRQVVQQSA